MPASISIPPSPVRALMALAFIGGDGIQRSIIFNCLPDSTQKAIRAASSEDEKITLAAESGDALPGIMSLYEHYIAAPARRSVEGSAFPMLLNLDEFPLPGVISEKDRAWVRPGQRIESIESQEEPNTGHWFVAVRYNDGVAISISEGCTSQAGADFLKREIRKAAFMLALLD